MALVRLRCTLQNASSSISGIDFSKATDALGGMVSVPIEETTAAYFKDIPGYVIEPPNGPAKKKLTPPAGAGADSGQAGAPGADGQQQALNVDTGAAGAASADGAGAGDAGQAAAAGDPGLQQ